MLRKRHTLVKTRDQGHSSSLKRNSKKELNARAVLCSNKTPGPGVGGVGVPALALCVGAALGGEEGPRPADTQEGASSLCDMQLSRPLSLVPARPGPTAGFSAWQPPAYGRGGSAGGSLGSGPSCARWPPVCEAGGSGAGVLPTQFLAATSAVSSFTVDARGPERARGSEGHPANKAPQGLQLPQ